MRTTLDEFLGRRGLRAPMSYFLFDKLCPHYGMTQGAEKQFLKDADKAIVDYHSRRDAAIAEYGRLLSVGEITEKTAMERRIETANGHPDNESTQAARRILERMSIDWRLGIPDLFVPVAEDVQLPLMEVMMSAKIKGGDSSI
jgi:hypothetical protein